MGCRGVQNAQGGQLIVEAILITIVFMGISLLVANQFRSHHLLAKIVEGPWKTVAGMMECGSWNPPKVACTMHPNLLRRHLSVAGDPM